MDSYLLHKSVALDLGRGRPASDQLKQIGEHEGGTNIDVTVRNAKVAGTKFPSLASLGIDLCAAGSHAAPSSQLQSKGSLHACDGLTSLGACDGLTSLGSRARVYLRRDG